jgi:antitoxin component of MazEF toxin-antitoxin module
MPRLFVPRKITKIGDSTGMTLPPDLLRTYNLKEGDTVTLIFDSEIDATLGDNSILAIDLKGRSGAELWKMLDRLFE